MNNSQYIEKRLMSRVHIYLNHRKLKEPRMKIREILNEVVELGLEEYAVRRGITFPLSLNEEEEE